MTVRRVATANIRHGLGPDGRVDLPRLAREIAALEAEVIGLQEVDVAFGERSGHVDQAAQLAALLGMQVCFGAALDLPPQAEGGPRRQYGLALLTSHEILSHRMHPLPDAPSAAPSSEPRGMLHARLRDHTGEELDALVTHLEHTSRAHRAAQVQGILHLTERIEGAAVLMGDVNADPSAPELAALSAAGWRDAAEEALPGRWRRRPRATHPAWFPVHRIDALWVRGAITVSALEVGPQGSSDHRPVVATLGTTSPPEQGAAVSAAS